MDTMESSVQVFPLCDLLSSTLVATVDADTATAQRYFNNLCRLAFEEFDARTNEAGSLRMLTFRYTTPDGTPQSLNVPVLSLVPLPLLQVKDADFGFDVHIVDLLVPEDADDDFSLEDDAGTPDAPDGVARAVPSRLRVSLLPFSRSSDASGATPSGRLPNMKVNIRLQQADVPGGLARFLQAVNNVNLKPTTNNQSKNESEHE